MIASVAPSAISGSMTAPPSKSLTQRALAAALLHKGISIIHNTGRSNDDLSTLEVIQNLGAAVTIQPDGSITVVSKGIYPKQKEINCGESGLGIRMFAPIAALSDKPVMFTGKGSLLNRPMHFFRDVFPALGVEVQLNNGKLPLQIRGPLTPADITVDGSFSSQFITGLLMAYAATGYGATITVKDLASKPYIDLTLGIIKAFGLNVPVNDGYKRFVFSPIILNDLSPVHYTIEGDWSSASFMLAAAAIAGNVSVSGLNPYSLQADKAILEVLEMAGCRPFIYGNEITVSAATLQSFEFDAQHCPDLFPPLVALAAYCKGTSVIKGVNRLKHKESDRGKILQKEFGKMGVEITLENDTMYITGSRVKGATIDPHNDHRIAMACAIAGLKATGEMIIENAEVVNKSYPGFFNDLAKLNCNVNTGDGYL